MVANDYEIFENACQVQQRISKKKKRNLISKKKLIKI